MKAKQLAISNWQLAEQRIATTSEIPNAAFLIFAAEASVASPARFAFSTFQSNSDPSGAKTSAPLGISEVAAEGSLSSSARLTFNAFQSGRDPSGAKPAPFGISEGSHRRAKEATC
jgi:hypothetical protein